MLGYEPDIVFANADKAELLNQISELEDEIQALKRCSPGL